MLRQLSEAANQGPLCYNYKHFMRDAKIGKSFTYGRLDQSAADGSKAIGRGAAKSIQHGARLS